VKKGRGRSLEGELRHNYREGWAVRQQIKLKRGQGRGRGLAVWQKID
jgi:hypothetical protein